MGKHSVKSKRMKDLVKLSKLNYNQFMKVLHCNDINISKLRASAMTFNNNKLKTFFLMKTNTRKWYRNLSHNEMKNVDRFLQCK